MKKSTPNQTQPYFNLGVMAVLSFVAMYFLMYSMVNSVAHVYMSMNQAYMAALMAAPMVVIELIVMRMMYPDARLNRLVVAGSLVVGIAMFLFIREQTAVGDRQFARSMIPHHSGAILMCGQASLTDSELKRLCQDIVSSQQREIDQLKSILQRLP